MGRIAGKVKCKENRQSKIKFAGYSNLRGPPYYGLDFS
jgi:hypothetical protein